MSIVDISLLNGSDRNYTAILSFYRFCHNVDAVPFAPYYYRSRRVRESLEKSDCTLRP